MCHVWQEGDRHEELPANISITRAVRLYRADRQADIRMDGDYMYMMYYRSTGCNVYVVNTHVVFINQV